MTGDALYLTDMFKMQYDFFKSGMLDKNLRRDKFDRYSYSSWAIKETLDAINAWDGYLCVQTIREILREQIGMYEMFYHANENTQERYKHALNAVKYLYKLTEGYCYE